MERPLPKPQSPPSTFAVIENLAWVRGLARSLASTPAAADDLAQETWRRALENPPPAGLPMRAWLSGVLRRTAVDQRRSESRRKAREKRAARPEAVPSDQELTARLEQSREMANLVSELEEPYRRVVLLRYFEGLGPTAIARQESLPVATVKTRLKRALEKLRRDVDDRHPLHSQAWLVLLAGPPTSSTILPTVPFLAGLAMKSNVLILAAVLLMLGGGFWWASSSQVAPLDILEPAPVSVVDAPEPVDSVAAASTGQLQESGRSAAATEVASADAANGTIKLRALDAATEEPLPDAEFWVLPYGDFPHKTRLGFDPEPFAAPLDDLTLLADGSVQLPRPKVYSLLIARSGDLYGTVYVHSSSPDEISVRCVVDRTLQVQVVDSSGHPVDGIGVVLQEGLDDSRRFAIESETEGSKGIANMAHLDTILPPDTRQGKLYNLAFASPVEQQPLLPFDPDAPLTGPIVLELPPTGALAFEIVDADGAEIDYTGWLHVSSVQPGASGGSQRGARHGYRVDHAGRVDIANVGLGMTLLVDVAAMGQLRPVELEIQGPEKAGETVRTKIVFAEAYPAFQGRIVRKGTTPYEGPPITSWSATLEVLDRPEDASDALHSERATLAADGSFLLPVTSDVPRGAMCRVRLLQRAQRASETSMYAEFVASVPSDGDAVDVGEIKLLEMPLIAAGRVVDPAGQPLEGADLQVAGKLSLGSDTPGFKWGFRGLGSAFTNSAGEFEIRGFQPKDEYALRPRKRGFQGRGFIPFQHGEHGIELVLDRPATLSGQVLVSDEIPQTRLRLELRYHGADPKAAFYDQKVLPLGFDGEFQFEDLRPGTVDLIVRTGSLAEPLHVQADIELSPGSGEDGARLKPIDLRGKLRLIDVLAEGDSGEPVERGYVSLDGRNYHLTEGRARVIRRSGPTGFVVHAPGYLPAEGTARDHETVVQLERTIPVSITLGTELPEAPDGTQALVGLSPQFGDRERLVVFDENDEEQVWSTRWLAVDYQRVDGKAFTVLHVPTHGEYRLQWMVIEARSPGSGGGQWWINDLHQNVEVVNETMQLRIEPDVETFKASLTR